MLDVYTIFFDVDGTLLDATRDIAIAMNRALKAMNLPERSYEEIVSYIGTGVSYLVSKSIGSEEGSLVEKGVRLYGEYYAKHPADHAVIYPHVKETLEYFKNKKKYVLTNRYSWLADEALKAVGLRHYFIDIIGGDDETCLKPSPCVFERLEKKYGFDRKKSVVVGDMAVDVEAGKNAGITACWVTYGLGRREEVERLKPEYVLDDISELKKIIRP